MSTIVLPPLHRSARYAMRKVYAASDPGRPAFGPSRPIDRPGDHWMIEVEAPAMATGCGLSFMADIVQGQTTAIRIPEPGVDKGAIGSPTVEGAGQAGRSLAVSDLTPWSVVRKGWFLSVLTDGTHYAYQVSAEVVANEFGYAVLPIWPMLLVPHANNDAVAISEPWLQGPLTEGGSFDVSRPAAVRPSTFTIEQGL